MLYLSYYLKLHRQEYYDRLNLVRERGDFEQWIAFFLRGVLWTSESAMETIRKILLLKEQHKKILVAKQVSSPLAIVLLDYLFEKPHLTIQDVQKQLHISYPTAKGLIDSFHKIGIVKEITGRKRDKRFTYWEYLDCLAEGT